MIRRRLTLLALLCAPLMAWSQAYPNKPIRLVVPYAPGGAVDSLARPVAQKLSEILGQPVIVDNRPGANATLGADNVARSSPDGYSIVLTSIVHYLVPFFSKNVPYDTMKDFTPIAQMAITPNILAVHPSMPVNSIKELIDYAKKNPGKIDFASLGVGSQPHVALEAWSQRLGIKLNHVPYKTNPSPDVMSGVISLSVEASTTAIPLIKTGKVKALGISGAQRIPNLPDVPTMTEFDANLDVNGVIGSSWHGIFAPTGTPNDVIAKLNAEIVKIVKTPEIQGRMLDLGLTPTGTTSAALDAVANSDYAFWNKVVNDLNIKVD